MNDIGSIRPSKRFSYFKEALFSNNPANPSVTFRQQPVMGHEQNPEDLTVVTGQTKSTLLLVKIAILGLKRRLPKKK